MAPIRPDGSTALDGWVYLLLVIRRTRKSLPKHLLGKACGYLLNQWETLEAHTRLGHTEIDDSLVVPSEATCRSAKHKANAIRPSAVGKKNWLFIGHPDAGDRTAIIYSIIGSCRRRGINPHDYLRDVLTRLLAMSNQEKVDVLLPSEWKPAAIDIEVEKVTISR
jgi:transposase